MGKLIEEYELVKETHYGFEEIEETIKVKIYEVVFGLHEDVKYTWTINYYAHPEGAGPYIPGGGAYAESLQGIESKIKSYLKNFEKEGTIVPNEDY